MKAAANSKFIGQIGPYQLVRELSFGGMGRIYEAWDQKLERKVAVKILKPEVMSDAQIRAKFEIEGKALAKLNHPHVVRVYVFDQEDGINYMVMEFIEGKTLGDFLESSPQPLRAQVRIFLQVMEGLKAAHSAGLIHRDIKPGNIMIEADGTAKLIDFGLAKEHVAGTADKTTGELFWGTPNYAAPEMFSGSPASISSDIYAAGVLFFYMLAGPEKMKQAFPSQARGAPAVAFAHLLNPMLPYAIKTIVTNMTQKNPRARYQSVEEVLFDLNQLDWGQVDPELAGTQNYQFNTQSLEKIRTHLNAQALDAQETALILSAVEESGDVDLAIQKMEQTRARVLAQRLKESPMTNRNKIGGWKSVLSQTLTLLSLVILGFGLYKSFPVIQKKWREDGRISSFATGPKASSQGLKVRKLSAGQEFSFTQTTYSKDGRTPMQSTRKTFAVVQVSDAEILFRDEHGQMESWRRDLLEIGPGEEKTVTLGSAGQDRSYQLNCAAETDYFVSKTAAGDFQTLKIQCQGGLFATETFWIAPKLGFWVSRAQGNPPKRIDISGYGLAR